LVMDVENYLALGLDQPPPEKVNDQPGPDFMLSLNHPGDRMYHPCPEAYPGETVPAGTVKSFRDWGESSAYNGTLRDLWIYTPPGFEAGVSKLKLIVCNDGAGYISRNGAIRAPQVLDSMLVKDGIQPTVGIFINPGNPQDLSSVRNISQRQKIEGNESQIQRSYEYDSLTSKYGDFLLQDVLPFVERELECQFSSRPEDKTIAGISSGGICAFNVAWHFPEVFGRVLSHCGSFTNIRGGHNYPYLIRSTERKPIRVYLQSGENDLRTPHGDWSTANLAMDKAFEYAGYDYTFEYGTGGHTLRHGGALFADSLRWLWRD
jgi:enterochelin esterase-like enzyme